MKRIIINGVDTYYVDDSVVVVAMNSRYYIRKDNQYINASDAVNGFESIQAASEWIYDNFGLEKYTDTPVEDNTSIALSMIGAYPVGDHKYKIHTDAGDVIITLSDKIHIDFPSGNGAAHVEYDLSELGYDRMLRRVESWLKKNGIEACSALTVCKPITAAINTRNLAEYINHVKSSNIWGYYYYKPDRKTRVGSLLIQFKNKYGGKGDVYIYYDVPFTLFRKLESTNSKGHFFWVYIRNNFKYSKLTGNKRGVLPNAINHGGL